jgi:hypothetical protein
VKLWVIKDFRGYYRSNQPDETYTPDLLFAKVFDSEKEAAEERDIDETVIALSTSNRPNNPSVAVAV